jgi:hypothetical protein
VSRLVTDQLILSKPIAHKVVRRDGINAMLVQAALALRFRLPLGSVLDGLAGQHLVAHGCVVDKGGDDDADLVGHLAGDGSRHPCWSGRATPRWDAG